MVPTATTEADASKGFETIRGPQRRCLERATCGRQRALNEAIGRAALRRSSQEIKVVAHANLGSRSLQATIKPEAIMSPPCRGSPMGIRELFDIARCELLSCVPVEGKSQRPRREGTGR